MQLGGDPLLEFALPDDLPLVRADAAQLERVFSNLIENAVKFSPPARRCESAAEPVAGGSRSG
jgi:two-component system sensor histidine kinase KdpD